MAFGDFAYTKFQDDVSFWNSNIAASFWYVVFEKISVFDGTKFPISSFSGVSFLGPTSFQSTIFKKRADFDGTEFLDYAVFYSSHFEDSATFSISAFSRGVIFQKSKFYSYTDFSGAKMGSKADFSYSEFLGAVKFELTELPDTLLLSNFKTVKDFDLRFALPINGKCVLDLRGGTIDKLILTYDYFKILIPDSTLSSIDYQELNSVYEQLLNNFKKRGYLTSFEKLDKEYQDFRFTRNPERNQIVGHTLNLVNRWWNYYGYSKEWIWPWTGGFLILFTVINWIFLPTLVFNVYRIDRVKEVLLDHISERSYKFFPQRYLQVMPFCIIPAFFYTCYVFLGLRMSIERMNLRLSGFVIYVLIQYLLGVICLGYLANFILSSR